MLRRFARAADDSLPNCEVGDPRWRDANLEGGANGVRLARRQINGATSIRGSTGV